MIFYDTQVMIGVMVFKLTQNRIEEITEDEVMNFEWHFVEDANKKTRSFLRITRNDLIEFCDNNKEFVWYDRGLDVLKVKKIDAETAFHFYWDYGMKAIHDYGQDILEDVWATLSKAIGMKG